jgi:hypothetical protein
MDLTQSIIARSDQLNGADLIGGPQTFTVVEVRSGDSEQPVSIVLAEWPASRPFKPSKTVLRLLVSAWGKESNDWPKGARMTLYRDPKVKWAGQEVGGIRVSHLSHIPKQLKVALQESKGKSVLHTIDPLPDDAPTVDHFAQVAETATLDDLKALWRSIKRDLGTIPEPLADALTARAAELTPPPAPDDEASVRAAERAEQEELS